MTTGTGIDAQFGIAFESSYGTYTAPTAFFEFISESIAADTQKVYGKSIRSSRFQRSDRVQTFVQGAAGDVDFEVLTKGFGKLFKAIFGAVATSQPDAVLKPNEYVHSFTPDASGKKGLSFTAQVGRPAIDGTVVPFSYPGGKIPSAEFSANFGEALMLKTTLDFKTEDTAQTLAAATYPTGAEMLTFIGGSVKVDGSDLFVKSASVAIADAMATDRHGLGNTKREPLANGAFDVTGALEAEFEALSMHTKITAGTQGSLELNFTLGEIDEGQANPFMVKFTIPVIEFTGDPPTVGDTNVLPMSLKFKALKNSTDPIITLDYHTTDATV